MTAAGDRLMIGTAGFGSWVGERAACEIVETACALGLYRFDTAAAYGRSEGMLGLALSRCPAPALVATKISPAVDIVRDRPIREQILRLVERSLKRLRRDRIDLLQLHDPLPPALAAAAFDAFGQLHRQGMIGQIGLCNHDAAALRALHACLPDASAVRPVALQNQHNLLSPGAGREVVAQCEASGLGLWAWSPLAGGLLAGGYSTQQPAPPQSRAALGHWLPVDAVAPHLPALDALRSRHGSDLARFALAWVLASDGVRGAVLGPSRAEHLDLVVRLAAGTPQAFAATTIW